MDQVIDRINLDAMRSAGAVETYSGPDYLLEHERLAFAEVAAEVRGAPVLDIGVGGGRTVRALHALSDDYLGIDYSPEMIGVCRARFPDLRFEQMDARRMDGVADDSIALAVFSCNGISMVGHEDRLAILKEVRRVLRPGGAFIFTTYNRNSPQATAPYRVPDFSFSANPARLLVRSARWVKELVVSLDHRRRFVKHEVHTPTFAVINDRCHHYGVMLYYITLSEQRRQLVEAGFAADAVAYEPNGRRIEDDTRFDSMLLIARKR